MSVSIADPEELRLRFGVQVRREAERLGFDRVGFASADIPLDEDHARYQAFLADDFAGLQVVDIADPANPTLIGTYDTPGFAWGVAVAGDMAFVADDASGLQVIQVFQHEVKSPTQNIGRSLAVDGSPDTIVRVRLESQSLGVTWEISANGGTNWQPILPNFAWNTIAVQGSDLQWRSTLAWAPGFSPIVDNLQIEWEGSTSGVADGSIVPAVFALRANAPNPFRAGTQIRFELPVESSVTLEVFDIAGRRVRTLVQDLVPAGNYTESWDGTDSQGRNVAGGVYLYRLQAGSFESTHRMVLLP